MRSRSARLAKPSVLISWGSARSTPSREPPVRLSGELPIRPISSSQSIYWRSLRSVVSVQTARGQIVFGDTADRVGVAIQARRGNTGRSRHSDMRNETPNQQHHAQKQPPTPSLEKGTGGGLAAQVRPVPWICEFPRGVPRRALVVSIR
jgi:hypothetical protein